LEELIMEFVNVDVFKKFISKMEFKIEYDDEDMDMTLNYLNDATVDIERLQNEIRYFKNLLDNSNRSLAEIIKRFTVMIERR